MLRPCLASLLLAVLSAAPDIPEFARDLPKIRVGEPVFRFNGKDLTGFYTYLHDHKYEDPDRVITVEDGVIRVSGREFGGFATNGNFRDYHLLVEWRWGEETWPPREGKARDSGILLHCVGPDGGYGGHWMVSQECQLIEGGSGDLLMVGTPDRAPSLTAEVRFGDDKQPYFHKGGESITRTSGRYNWWGRDPSWKDVAGFRGKDDVERPLGEWNRMEVICDGDTITNILNGYVVNIGTKSSLTEGKLLFQSEGAEIHFRTIEIRPLIH